MSFETIKGDQSLQWSSDQPITVAVWDGACQVDTAHQTIINAQSAPCTLELQSETYATWHFFELA